MGCAGPGQRLASRTQGEFQAVNEALARLSWGRPEIPQGRRARTVGGPAQCVQQCVGRQHRRRLDV
eukprot:scaffold128645_cov21-Phaeocystis_antarctica.AAC.1